MKICSAIISFALALATASTVAAQASFANVSGRQFNIDGRTGWFVGSNSYWISFLTNNSDVDSVMSHLNTTGMKVLRVWGFNDITTPAPTGQVWFQSLINGSDPVINTGADGLERLDAVVASAEAHGIKLIINFVNNWSDYGGMKAYVEYYRAEPVTNWYNTTAIQTQYQAYIKAVISRYLNSTAVFAWELANEPRCEGCDPSILTNWITTTAAYIKSLDPNHMVCIGDEGFGLPSTNDTTYPWTFGPGLDFAANLKIPDIDFGTFHLYPQGWGHEDTWGPSWITAHDAIGQTVGKPVVLEEYGAYVHLDEGPWHAIVESSSIALDMYWQWGDIIGSTGQNSSDDGYTLYYGDVEWTTMVPPHVAAMNAKPNPS